jgi:hypothetical protein
LIDGTDHMGTVFFESRNKPVGANLVFALGTIQSVVGGSTSLTPGSRR